MSFQVAFLFYNLLVEVLIPLDNLMQTEVFTNAASSRRSQLLPSALPQLEDPLNAASQALCIARSADDSRVAHDHSAISDIRDHARHAARHCLYPDARKTLS